MSKIKEVIIDINRLGALSETKLRMNRFVLLSGESGLGKTYVSVLCNYVYMLLTRPHLFDGFFKAKGLDDNYLQHLNSEVTVEISKNELEEWIKGNVAAFLRYMLNLEKGVDVTYHLPLKEQMTMTISTAQQGLLGDEVRIARVQVEQSPSYSYTLGGEQVNSRNPFTAALQYYMQETILGTSEALSVNYILPPGRGVVMTEDMTPKTGLYSQFKRQFDRINESQIEVKKEKSALGDAITAILDGSVYAKEGQGFFYTTRGAEIPVAAAASSIREMAPLSLFVEKYDLRKCSLMIEEPEAHLHPLKQRMMADVLSLMFEEGSLLVVSTHSDYFLRRMNEILSVQRIIQDDPEGGRQLAKQLRIVTSIGFNRSAVSAYVLKRNPETGIVAITEKEVNGNFTFESFDDVLRIDMDNYDAIQAYHVSKEEE